MKKIIVAMFIGLILTGCQTTNPVDISVTKYQVVTPPDQFLKCNPVQLPKSFKTNADVAKELAHIYQDERICANNAKAVREFLSKAQKDIQ